MYGKELKVENGKLKIPPLRRGMDKKRARTILKATKVFKVTKVTKDFKEHRSYRIYKSYGKVGQQRNNFQFSTFNFQFSILSLSLARY